MDSVVIFALRQRVLMVVLLVLVLVLGAGVVSFQKLNIEAYPDPVPPLVDIVTQSTGQSAEEIEQYFAVRPIRREVAVHLRLYLRAGRAMGDQPAGTASTTAQRCPSANLAVEPNRRDLSLPRSRAAWLL
jgi:AcrB/AcrD/AcrF family